MATVMLPEDIAFSPSILDWFDCPIMFSEFPNVIPVLLLCVSFCLLCGGKGIKTYSQLI